MISGSELNAGDERELITMRWGMPPPRTGGPTDINIRNTASPHWRYWLKPENRCLVPANSFVEYAPESTPETWLHNHDRGYGFSDVQLHVIARAAHAPE